MLLCDINPHIRHASTGVIRLAPDDTSSLDCRIFYLRDGTLTFTLDGTSYDITDGTLLCWQAGRRYRFEMKTGVTATVINFDLTQEHRDIPKIMPIPADTLNPGDVIIPPIPDDCPELSQLMIRRGCHMLESGIDALVEEFNSQKKFGRENASALLKQLLIDALRGADETPHRESIVRHTIAFIEENFAKPITNRDVAAHVRYHEYYLNRLMREHTGMTLHRYLLSVRIRSAARMLLDTDYPAAKIAELCGFSTPAHFAQVFGEHMGTNPTAFRKGERII